MLGRTGHSLHCAQTTDLRKVTLLRQPIKLRSQLEAANSRGKDFANGALKIGSWSLARWNRFLAVTSLQKRKPSFLADVDQALCFDVLDLTSWGSDGLTEFSAHARLSFRAIALRY